MANNAYVNVKNAFQESYTLNVKRLLSTGDCDLEEVVQQSQEKLIQLPSPDVSLAISIPEGVDLRDCRLLVRTDVDYEVLHSRTDAQWICKIIPNDLPPDTPTSVNLVIDYGPPD